MGISAIRRKLSTRKIETIIIILTVQRNTTLMIKIRTIVLIKLKKLKLLRCQAKLNNISERSAKRIDQHQAQATEISQYMKNKQTQQMNRHKLALIIIILG